MNGGKDVKLGDDKRVITLIPNDEQQLYNVSSGKLLTDEFGSPVITEVDAYYLPDANTDRSTSVVLSNKVGIFSKIGISTVAITTATYNNVNSNRVGINTANISIGDIITGRYIPKETFVSRIGIGTVYLSNKTTNSTTLNEKVKIERKSISSGKSNPVLKIAEQFKEVSEVSTTLLGINRAEVQLSLFSNVSSYGLDNDDFEYYIYRGGVSFGTWENRQNKIYGSRYQAKVTEETQESGIQLTAFPVPYTYPFGPKFNKPGTSSFYNSLQFPQYKKFITAGNLLYTYFDTGAGSLLGYPLDWKDKFLSSNFAFVNAEEDVEYPAGYDISFAQIDTWTETWKDIVLGTSLRDPVTGANWNQTTVQNIIGIDNYSNDSTRPGYSNTALRYVYLQSRKVFRYQPGRISGFTFGTKCISIDDMVPGVQIEWGIANPTDQYVFRVDSNSTGIQIIRRSTVPLSLQVLTRNGLTSSDQDEIPSGDPFDEQQYYTITLTSDKFNGDPLNGNGRSGYTLDTGKVTMYKIEFGWYGAIGARFYVYTPADNGEARWIVVHTLVIENSLLGPCLQDSYFRFKYSVSVPNTRDVRIPYYLYKYGASYYIDGGDEGTSQFYSVSTKQKKIFPTERKSLLAINPKDYILNSTGEKIKNKKIIIPTSLNITSDSLSEVKVVTCKACPGFGHVYTPGLATTENGRYVDIRFINSDTISGLTVFKPVASATGNIGILTDLITGISTTGVVIGQDVVGLSTIVSIGTTVTSIGTGTIGIFPETLNVNAQTGIAFSFGTYETSSFTEDDIGAKLIAPSIYNAYIYSLVNKDENTGIATAAIIRGYDTKFNWIDRDIAGGGANAVKVYDRVTGITTVIGITTYPYPVRLSNYDSYAASNYKFTGSNIEIQFVNPNIKDSYAHFADFLVGVTNRTPIVTEESNTLQYFEVPVGAGIGTTTILPNSSILFGEHTHQVQGQDENGVEISETWYPQQPSIRMGIDYRIPPLSNPAGGICSKLIVEVQDPLFINGVTEYNGNPDPSIPGDTTGTYYLQVQGTKFVEYDFDGGQVTTKIGTGNPSPSPSCKFVGAGSTYTQSISGVTTQFSYIQISQTLGLVGTNFTLVIRPVRIYEPIQVNSTSNQRSIDSSKIFNYNPFPLYLVFKMKDYAQINNISVKEIIGDNQNNIAPKLFYYQNKNTSITDASGNADTTGSPPTNYKDISRLSSALVDIQNQQNLRPYTDKDTLFVGANSTNTIDMKKIFGSDRTVITPDNNNLEATFIIAKKLDGGDFGFIEASLNFKEQ